MKISKLTILTSFVTLIIICALGGIYKAVDSPHIVISSDNEENPTDYKDIIKSVILTIILSMLIIYSLIMTIIFIVEGVREDDKIWWLVAVIIFALFVLFIYLLFWQVLD